MEVARKFQLPVSAPRFIFTCCQAPAEATDLLTGPPGRILVAEDEPAMRTMVEQLLRRNGWEVVLAENGREAVELWEKGGIDFVLMDLKMAVMDGITVAREIRGREDGGGKKVCIIALTAHTRAEVREECLAAGMDGFLTKPMCFRDLDETVNNCVH